VSKQVAEKVLGYVILILISFILFYLASRQVGGEQIIMNNPEAVYDQSASSAEQLEKNSMPLHSEGKQNFGANAGQSASGAKIQVPSGEEKDGHFHAVQLGAFTTKTAAKTFLAQMKMIGVDDSYVVKRSNPVRFVVVVGSFKEIADARAYKKKLLGMDIEGFVVKL